MCTEDTRMHVIRCMTVMDWKIILIVGRDRYLDWEVEREMTKLLRHSDGVVVRWEGIVRSNGAFDREGYREWVDRACAGCVSVVCWWEGRC